MIGEVITDLFSTMKVQILFYSLNHLFIYIYSLIFVDLKVDTLKHII